MKRVIVSGGNGFIGRYVVSELLRQGCECIIIDRRIIGNCPNDVQQIQSNLSGSADARSCAKLIESADAFIHLAADITVPGNAATVGNNIEGMHSALEIAKATGVKHFILLSSIPVIGSIKMTPITEEHPVNPDTPYHWSKYLCEKMLELYQDCFIATILRIPSPIGIGMRENVFITSVIRKLKDGKTVEVYGNGKRIQNYIDVRDIANAIVNVIKLGSHGLFLLAGSKSVSNIDLVRLCKDIINSNSVIEIGKHADLEENCRWIISCAKSNNEFGFQAQYSLRDSIEWIMHSLV